MLGLVLPANYLALEVRLGAIGVWELSGGDIQIKVYDPIVVLPDITGSVTLSDTNTIFQKTDFPARNKWSHIYYRYKPEVHNRPLRLDEAPSGATSIIQLASTAATPKLHLQMFGSWRAV